ncbi:hypothetical protein B0O80DRAFT_189907 [Mortierella sp. GBAus27b]|nr:hypothetical protein B0O80DRAFT_189907 [Mortierella sp. GBAus27b]
MAPKTPQANTKLPKSPLAGGSAPASGLPPPTNVLQRRTTVSSSPGTGAKMLLKNMTPEQEALLAEALAIHSPGLIDMTRKANAGSDGSTGLDHPPPLLHRSGSPLSNGASPSLNPQSTSAASASQPVARRLSSSRLGMETPLTPDSTGSPSTLSPVNYHQLSRPTSYTGMSPLSITNPSLPSLSSTPSPTTPVGAGLGVGRRFSGSPAAVRTALPASRLSIGPGPPASNARGNFMKQPLFQRPPGMPMLGTTTPSGTTTTIPEAKPLSSVPASPAIAPPSLDDYEIGDRVIVESMALSGYLRFLGPAEFKTGTWAGIELDTPTGKNDGTVQDVTYFQCRPKHGIFVLAAKIAKSELLFATPQSTSVQEETSDPSGVDHAAQAASRISAGSRASKYLGMTATQLKQRNSLPHPMTVVRSSSQSLSNLPGVSHLPGPSHLPGSSARAASPTIRTLSGMSGSPTAPRTISSSTSGGGRTDSPSPVLKPHFRSASPTARIAAGNRLSQPGIKPAPVTLASKGVVHSRSTSSTSSQSSPTGTRTGTSPTPRTLASPRRLSSRTEAPDFSHLASSNANLLDQATAVQTSSSHHHPDFETSIDESDFKSHLDESILLELEDLRARTATLEKEKMAKEQELKVVTDKMTQAWLDAARSQREKTAIIQEKSDLIEKLRVMGETGGSPEGSALVAQEQQTLIDSLQKNLQEADEKALALESQIQDLTTRAAEEEDKLIKAREEDRVSSETKVAELEAERDNLNARVVDLETTSQTTAQEAAQVKAQLDDVQNKLNEQVEARRATESQVQETQGLLAKSEKQARGLEEKVKEFEATVGKRDQEIAGLKLELQDIAGMVQSEEVDRMRKVWELEKKRLEEAVADNITVMTNLRTEIQTLETTEEELLEKLKTSEASIAIKDAEEAFAQERSALEAKIAEVESSIESRLSDSKERMEELEAIALTVEEWRERCEAMQFEMIQKTAAVEDYGLKLADAQDHEDALRLEVEGIKKQLAESSAVDQAAALESSRAEIAALEEGREQLLVKVSELEGALALAASAPRAATTTSGSGDKESALDRAELEEEIAALKQMVHELTAENATVASDNKKLMQEHDILMEAHKHVETECLKLMDEVERLHAESLAVASMGGVSDGVDKNMDMVILKDEKAPPRIAQEELKAALDNVTAFSKDAAVVPSEKQSGQSASVIRLEGMLKEKQATLDRLTQAHALEMRDLRQRYVELDRTKTLEISQLHKELTDLESLIESKIFREADLEEEVQKRQKQIDRLQKEVSDLKAQVAKLGGSAADLPPNGLSSKSSLPGSNGVSKAPVREKTTTGSTDKALFCEICEKEGHDVLSCEATFGSTKATEASTKSTAPVFANTTAEDDERMYCDNCEVFGDHYTDECPNESETY